MTLWAQHLLITHMVGSYDQLWEFPIQNQFSSIVYSQRHFSRIISVTNPTIFSHIPRHAISNKMKIFHWIVYDPPVLANLYTDHFHRKIVRKSIHVLIAKFVILLSNGTIVKSPPKIHTYGNFIRYCEEKHFIALLLKICVIFATNWHIVFHSEYKTVIFFVTF